MYFIPTFIADFRRHRNFNAICIANIILGWTVIGWVGTLIWSFTNNTEAASSVNS
jgi:hypothetical protein